MAAANQGARLQIEGLSKSFGELSVLSSLSLSIEPGEFVAVVGRSGCGKSTLLRLIAGLEAPTTGGIELDGHAVFGVDPDARVLFQESRLLPWKSVLGNVRIGAPRRDARTAQEALRHVGLEDRASYWPGRLSGGQQQRVSLARALVGHPRLLLMDEPLGALDALTRLDMQRLIERLWHEQGFTIILVTHDVSEAVALADRVLLVEDGAITLDMRIALDRPRQRDAGFAHYESIILNRVLGVQEELYAQRKEAVYTI